MMQQSLFVTGTDTGVGKSLVTALLVLKLQSLGLDAGVMKPIASGCVRQGAELVSDDAQWLQEVTGVSDELDLINPVRLEEPLAPLVAARRCGQASHDFVERSLAAFSELSRRHDCVVVEGVGGLLVPISEREASVFTVCELLESLQLPALLVARRTLGTINHTLLTCRFPIKRPAHIAGLVFCDAVEVAAGDTAASTSPTVLTEMTGLPTWGVVPFLNDMSIPQLKEASAKFIVPGLDSSE